MTDLFKQVTTILQDSQNPQIIRGITELLDRIRQDMQYVAPKCSPIFQEIIETARRKSESFLNQQEIQYSEYLKSLPIEELRLRSKEDISKALGLDSWNDSGNIEAAKTKIIECFKRNLFILELQVLYLTSIPNSIWNYLP